MAWSDNNDVFRFNSSFKKMSRIYILIPLIVLLIICIFSLTYLLSGKDPNKPPSALLNKDVPIFESSSLYNSKDIIKTKDIKNKKTLINFFASWCSPCKIEHPLFLKYVKNILNYICWDLTTKIQLLMQKNIWRMMEIHTILLV